MKHIKKFEKQGDSYWVYVRLNNTFPQIDDLQIFENTESANNFFITEVNQMAMEAADSTENLIFTVEEAQNYIDENEYTINIIEINSLGSNFQLPEELKIGRDAKKYNL